MYYNPYYYYWRMYPQMPAMCYPMGEAMKYYYQFENPATKDQKVLLRKIQELEFAALDLNLYLDTHPKDCKAIEKFNCYVRELKKYIKMYTEKYGPLTCQQESSVPWKYIQGPWPWEL